MSRGQYKLSPIHSKVKGVAFHRRNLTNLSRSVNVSSDYYIEPGNSDIIILFNTITCDAHWLASTKASRIDPRVRFEERSKQIVGDFFVLQKREEALGLDHNAACAKKNLGTGMWLVKSLQFSGWLTEENSMIWLNGFAGSGKSVLCSTATQFALRHRKSDPGVGIAFFYFTFNDESNRMSQLCYEHCCYNCRVSSKTAMRILPGCIDHTKPAYLHRPC